MEVKKLAAAIARRARKASVVGETARLMHVMSIIALVFLIVKKRAIVAMVVGAAIITLTGAIVISAIA